MVGHQVVSASLAGTGRVSRLQDYSQGVAPDSGGGGMLGQSMAGQSSVGPLRQHGSCDYYKLENQQRSGCHAPQEMPRILGSQVGHPFMVRARTRG